MANVELRNVTKKYGNLQVIHGIDMQVADGEIAVDLAIEGSTRWDVELFRMGRLTDEGGSKRPRPTRHS
jgi:ABC-type uncharacterized transport system ATPase subunit